jgi:hypothetical protein
MWKFDFHDYAVNQNNKELLYSSIMNVFFREIVRWEILNKLYIFVFAN